MSSHRNYSNAYTYSSNAVLGADIIRGGGFFWFFFVKNQGCGYYQRGYNDFHYFLEEHASSAVNVHFFRGIQKIFPRTRTTTN